MFLLVCVEHVRDWCFLPETSEIIIKKITISLARDTNSLSFETASLEVCLKYLLKSITKSIIPVNDPVSFFVIFGWHVSEAVQMQKGADNQHGS